MNAIQLKFNSLINRVLRQKDSPGTFTEYIANYEYILSAFLVVWDLRNVDPRAETQAGDNFVHFFAFFVHFL